MASLLVLARRSGFHGFLFQYPARALRLNGFRGSLFQFPALAPGLNALGGSLFPVELRMGAELVPRRLRKVDIIVFCCLLDVREGQSTIGIGDVDDLIEPRDGVTHMLCVGQWFLRCFGNA